LAADKSENINCRMKAVCGDMYLSKELIHERMHKFEDGFEDSVQELDVAPWPGSILEA